MSPTQRTRPRVALAVVLLASFAALTGTAAAAGLASGDGYTADSHAPANHAAADTDQDDQDDDTSDDEGRGPSLDELSREESIYSNESTIPESERRSAPPRNRSRNASRNATAPPAQGGGGGDDGWFGGVSLSPREWVMSAIHGLSERALEEVAASIDVINYVFVGLPAPGEISSPSSWHSPDDGWWPGVYHAMHVAQALGVIWLAFQLAVSFAYSSAKKRRESWKRQGVAWVMVLGATLFAPLGLHLFGELATSIVPEGQQFTEGFAEFSQFGMGVLLGAILVFLATTVVALAIVAIVAIYVLAHVVVLFWPLMWAAWASHGQARSYGSTGIYLYGVVCVVSVIQAFFLLAMFHIDWLESPLGPLGGLVGLTSGLLFSLVYFPIMLLKQAHIAGAVGLGVAAANSAGDALDSGKTAAVEKVEQRYSETWQSTSSTSSTQGRPSDVGGVGSRSAGTATDGGAPRGHTAPRSDDPAGSFGGQRRSAGTVQRRGFSSRFQGGSGDADRVNITHNRND